MNNIFRLSKYNINVLYFTPFQFNGLAIHEYDCVNNEKGIQWLQKFMGEDVLPCTMQNNSRPEITILEPIKQQTFYLFTVSLLCRASMMLFDLLRTVQSDSSIGGACSSSVLEILKRREKIRYVFQHYPSYFIDVSYIIFSIMFI